MTPNGRKLMRIKRTFCLRRTKRTRTTNCTPNDRTVRRRSWTFNSASTTPTDPLDRTVGAEVVVAVAEDVEVVEAARDVKMATAETEVTAETEEAAESVVVIAEAIVAADQVEVAEASEESHEVGEELRLPMSTTNRLSPLWAK